MPYTTLDNLAPEVWLCTLGLLVLALDMLLPRRFGWLTAGLAVVGLVCCLHPVLQLWGTPPVTDFGGAIVVDGFALFFKALAIVCGILVILLSVDSRRGAGSARPALASPGEYFSLLVFLVLGMCLLVGAGDLVLIYLAFELVSLTSYLLAAWRKGDRKSNEAGIKYFIYGAAASGVMVYGLTLLYGAGGSTNLQTLAAHLMQPTPGAGLALIAVLGAVLMAVGLGYKISMVPFHAWAPDVYEGAPTPVTALLSVGPKAAGFALLTRIFFTLAPHLHAPWQVIFAVLSACTMFGGNLLAIRQTNVKRLLAYSSIAHAGYLLIGVVVGPYEPWGVSGIAFYLTAYLLMNLGMFGVAILVERRSGSSEISAFSGLAKSDPGMAALAIVFLLSLTGIPPTAGFVGKLLIFGAAIHSRTWAWLALVGIVNSVISLFYYMNIARAMYFARSANLFGGHEPEGAHAEASARGFAGAAPVLAVVLLTALATLALCLFPGWLIDVSRAALMR